MVTVGTVPTLHTVNHTSGTCVIHCIVDHNHSVSNGVVEIAVHCQFCTDLAVSRSSNNWHLCAINEVDFNRISWRRKEDEGRKVLGIGLGLGNLVHAVGIWWWMHIKSHHSRWQLLAMGLKAFFKLQDIRIHHVGNHMYKWVYIICCGRGVHVYTP